MLAPTRSRVLVTDGETRAVVGLARGLRQAGFEVSAAGARSARPIAAHWSWSVNERLLLPHPLTDETAFIAELERQLSADRYAVLMPGSDASLLVISRFRDRLEGHVRLALPPHEVIERNLDKLALLAAAGRHGLDPPATVPCHSPAEARAAAQRFGYPVLVKPFASVFEVSSGLKREGSFVAVDEPALSDAVTRYGGSCLVEQRELGAVVSVAGVFADGEMLAQATSRYHRTWRPEAGSASYSETIDAPAGLSARVTALLSELRWEGLFELELIERPDGSCAAIDMNPRPYGSVSLAIAAGANLPAVWCEHVLGGRPDRVVARAGVFYRWTDADVRHAVWQARNGRPSAAAAVFSVRRKVVHPYFSVRDPGPSAARLLQLVLATARRRRSAAVRAQPGSPGDTPSRPRLGAPDAGRPPRRHSNGGGRRRETVVVIGAGPQGLAAAAHLRAAGIPTRSFGKPLETWRRCMPGGMILRSRKRSTHIADPGRELTIDRYERATGASVQNPSLRLEEFVDYGLWFQRHAVPDLDPRRVAGVRRDGAAFAVELSDGTELAAGRVVVAAGSASVPDRPPPYSGLPDSLVSHSVEHADLCVMSGRRVLIVGAGQSALESAALLREGGATVEVLARAASIRWLGDDDLPTPRLEPRRHVVLQPPPTDVGGRLSGWIAAIPDVYRHAPGRAQTEIAGRCLRPAGSSWLRPRLAGVPISLGATAVLARERDGEVQLRLQDGTERRGDHVLLATGFTIDVAGYPFLGPELIAEIRRAGGYPILGPGLESSVPGLHFLGAPAAFSFGPLMRFIVSTWYAAPALARCARESRQPPLRVSF